MRAGPGGRGVIKANHNREPAPGEATNLTGMGSGILLPPRNGRKFAAMESADGLHICRWNALHRGWITRTDHGSMGEGIPSRKGFAPHDDGTRGSDWIASVYHNAVSDNPLLNCWFDFLNLDR